MNEEISVKEAQSLETKARILKAALRLFNDQGSHTVTTHDIAEEAGISPGNLYYHFKNKKAIVRGLFYQIEVFSVNQWWENSPANREVRFADFMQFFFGSLSRHRFFFREFSSLTQDDEILAREWRNSYERLSNVMLDALNGWVKQGLIKPMKSQVEAQMFIETIWIVAAFSQVHLEARKVSASKKTILEESSRYLAKFLYPYHTEKGQRVIDLYL